MIQSRNFVHRDLGGGRIETTIGLRPTHINKGAGWREIINTLSVSGDPALTIGVDELVQFRVRPRLSGNAPVLHFGKGQSMVRLTPLATANIDGVVTGNAIRFNGAWTGADLEYVIAGHRLDENIYLRVGHPASFQFRIDEQAGFDPATLTFGKDFRFLQPVLRRGIEQYALTWDVQQSGGKWFLSTSLPIGNWSGWILDPTLTLQPDATAGIDTVMNKASSGTNYDTLTSINAGDYIGAGVGLQRSLIKFDLSGLPSNADISTTTLSLWLASDGSAYSTINQAFSVFRVMRAWVESQATWDIYSTGNNWGTAGCDNTTSDREASSIGTSATWLTTDLAGATRDTSIVGATKAALDLGNGWLAKMPDETTQGCFLYASSDHATAGYRPKLVVVYTVSAAAFTRAPGWGRW